MRDDDPRHPDERADKASLGQGTAEYGALIRELLRQTPEERLLGLRRAAAFFGAVRRL